MRQSDTLRDTLRKPTLLSMTGEYTGTGTIQQTHRRVWPAMRRGLFGKCPSCGEGRLFRAYLKVEDECASCGQELHHHRADDAPPYFTIFISGHIIIPLMILVERFWAPALWIHMALWLPLTVILCMALLPPIKGALVGLQWALRMHGFAGEDDDPVNAPPTHAA